MASAVVNPRDLRFQLFDVLGADALCVRARYRDHDRESLEAALDLAIQLADEVLWPNAPIGDRDEPRLENGRVRVPAAIHESVAAITDAGFVAAALDYDRGGMQLPAVLLAGLPRCPEGGRFGDGRLSDADQGGGQSARRPRDRRAEAPLHGAALRRALPRHDVPLGTRRGLLVGRHQMPGGPRRRRHLPALRQQDVDLGRRSGHLGEHRPSGPREAPRRAARRERESRSSSCPRSG